MRFEVTLQDPDFRTIKEFPVIYLKRDNWDDFGFKTMFDARLYLSHRHPPLELGPVKILKRGQEGGLTELPDKFQALGDDYCSLGQAFSYYEVISSLPDELVGRVLEGLRDVTWDPGVRQQFAEELGFRTSLVRFGGAELALEDATSLFIYAVRKKKVSLAFQFQTSVGGEYFDISFRFGDRRPLPSRINVLVGYNGCGKTQLLANLANVAHADLTKRERLSFKRKFGTFGQLESAPRFSSVITISYSAFDTFELPGKNREEESRLNESGDIFGYVYCGLRRYHRGRGQKTVTARALKDVTEIQSDLLSALARAQSPERIDRLSRVLRPLAQEPSFQRIGISESFDLSDFEWESKFERLSTGHKLVLNIALQLVAHLEPGSLVLIDEPESHLHPPLLAALLKSITIALEEFESYAVMATHSPVVLQEIPRRYVQVLQRFGRTTKVYQPEIETFGENVGSLTRHIFSLDSSATDYHSTLRELAESYSLSQVMDLFDGEVSSQALIYLSSLLRGGQSS